MATVHINQLEGSRGRENRETGWEVERIAVVEDVTGTGQAKLKNAVNASGMPDLGDEHPNISGLYLDEWYPESVSATVVRVRMIYREKDPADDPDYGTITTSSSLSQIETNVNNAGTLMQLRHTFPATDKDWPSEEKAQGVTLNKFVPEHTLVYTRRETSRPDILARQYVGKCNTGAWTLDPGALIYQWMCMSINGMTDDGGSSYEVTYTFQYRVGYWGTIATFIDPRTGRPPKDVLLGVGYGAYYLYDTIDFNGLNL